MGPQDWTTDLSGDVACDACGSAAAGDRLRVLARRDDLVFAELPCSACGSVSLAIVLPPSPPDPAGVRPAPSHDARPPIGPDDVVQMRRFLAGWAGDLRSLIDPAGPGGESPGAG